MRACYVNHHIVSRGRDAASAAPASAWRRNEQQFAPASRCTIKDDISRPIYITRERKSTSTSTHVGFIICAYISVCARRPEAALRAPRLDIRSARLFERTNGGANAHRNVPMDGALYWYPIWRRSPGFRRQRLPPRPFSFPENYRPIKRSVDLLRTTPRAQRDVLIVRLDRYDSSLYTGPTSISPLVGINQCALAIYRPAD